MTCSCSKKHIRLQRRPSLRVPVNASSSWKLQGSDSMETTDWVSVHLFYHGNLDLPLLEVVAPLAADSHAATLARSFFFLRHWDGGPHLRVRLRTVHRNTIASLQLLAERRMETYLRNSPSKDGLKNGDYAIIAKRLARWEGVARYRTQLYPNNSLRFIPYRRDYARYGPGPTLETVEQHFAEASRIALALLRQRPTADGRRAAAFAMTVLACRESGFLPKLYDGFGTRAGVVSGDSGFADRYQRQRDRLHGLIRAASERARSRDAGSSVLAAWRRSVVALRRGLTAAPPAPDAGKVIDMCGHLMCNRLGVPLEEERYIRYLASRTIEDLRKEDGI